MYWDDVLTVEPYESIKKIYYCGNTLQKYSAARSILYKLLVIDFSDCSFAEVYSDGEVKQLFTMHSAVPGKHKTGGQSAQRFERIRNNEVTLWFKRINEKLKVIDGEIIVGISDIYYKRFYKLLHTYNKEKILNQYPTEYSTYAGIYQLLNRITQSL